MLMKVTILVVALMTACSITAALIDLNFPQLKGIGFAIGLGTGFVVQRILMESTLAEMKKQLGLKQSDWSAWIS